MKKLIAVLLAFALLGGALSCASPKGSDASDTDSPADPDKKETAFAENFDNRFGRRFNNLIETEDAYYYCNFGGSYVYYYDKASGESGVLCGKAECTHDAEERNAGSAVRYAHIRCSLRSHSR